MLWSSRSSFSSIGTVREWGGCVQLSVQLQVQSRRRYSLQLTLTPNARKSCRLWGRCTTRRRRRVHFTNGWLSAWFNATRRRFPNVLHNKWFKVGFVSWLDYLQAIVRVITSSHHYSPPSILFICLLVMTNGSFLHLRLEIGQSVFTLTLIITAGDDVSHKVCSTKKLNTTLIQQRILF